MYVRFSIMLTLCTIVPFSNSTIILVSSSATYYSKTTGYAGISVGNYMTSQHPNHYLLYQYAGSWALDGISPRHTYPYTLLPYIRYSCV